MTSSRPSLPHKSKFSYCFPVQGWHNYFKWSAFQMIPTSFPDCETACLRDGKYQREPYTDRLIVYTSEKNSIWVSYSACSHASVWLYHLWFPLLSISVKFTSSPPPLHCGLYSLYRTTLLSGRSLLSKQGAKQMACLLSQYSCGQDRTTIRK